MPLFLLKIKWRIVSFVDGIFKKTCPYPNVLDPARVLYLERADKFLNLGGNDEQFPTLVRDGLNLSGVDHRKIAYTFQVAPTTIKRWANGTAMPGNGLQKRIVKELRKLVEES